MALGDVNKQRTVSNIKSISTDSNIILINTRDSYSIVDEFYFGPDNDRAVSKFIKNVEKLVRQSSEYKKYIEYLSNTQNLKNDVVMANIDSSLVELQFHHYPFTLYDIVDIMLEHNLRNKVQTTSISLAEKVMQEHFHNTIGLARLSATNHELAHEGAIYVPLKAVFGNVNEFINKYYDTISIELIEKYNQLVDIQNKRNYDNTRVFKD